DLHMVISVLPIALPFIVKHILPILEHYDKYHSKHSKRMRNIDYEKGKIEVAEKKREFIERMSAHLSETEIYEINKQLLEEAFDDTIELSRSYKPVRIDGESIKNDDAQRIYVNLHRGDEDRSPHKQLPPAAEQGGSDEENL